MADHIAFSATTSKDTLYYHQAMKADDNKQFQQAMNKEFNDHLDKKHYEVVSRDSILEGESILDYVWAMKRKRNILTNQVYKWKSRLNLHSGQQEYAVIF